MFEEPLKLGLGLLTGILFGFLLQKGRVAKFRVIMGQFLLKDWTVVKIMLTAVAVGAIGVWAMVEMGIASLHIRPAAIGAIIFGGLLFGMGMAIFGYCPGTSVAACGEGRRDAMVGVLGMLFGAGAYVAAYSVLQPLARGLGDLGKVTMPDITGISPWLYIGALALCALLLRLFAERHRNNQTERSRHGPGV